MKNNTFYNSQSIKSISSAIFLIAIFTFAAFTAQAQILSTTVAVSSDMDDVSEQTLVTVFDAQNGRQIASGLTKSTGEFRFAAAAEQTFVVIAVTRFNFVGTARGAAGSSISVSANQSETVLPSVCYDNGELPILLSYQNASGGPLKNARITIVDRYLFGNARRGKTNQQGQYTFNIPADMRGAAFLAAVWKGDGAIKLSRVTVGCVF